MIPESSQAQCRHLVRACGMQGVLGGYRTWCYRGAVQARARRGHANTADRQPTGRRGRSRPAVAAEAPHREERLPTGTVTFLFTDIEGSTSAWIKNPNAIRAALARHDALIESLVGEQGGQVVRPRGEGDSRFAVFGRATDGVAAACAIQVALVQEAWPAERCCAWLASTSSRSLLWQCPIPSRRRI
jgi:hypothetical protein